MMRFVRLLILMLTIGIVILLSACSHRLTKEVTLDNIVVYPSPPDTARIQFLTKFSNSVDITGERSPFLRYILGKDKGKPIIKPYGISIHKGKIYICDTMLGGLEIIDLEKRTFEYFRPGGMGLLKKPINCFVDEQGNLYVADTGRKQVVVFNPDLTYKGSFGDPRKMRITDVFVAGRGIWVSDMESHTVHVYLKDNYKHVYQFPVGKPKTDPFLSSPTNIFVTPDYVYVSDFGSFKIKVYERNGTYVRSIGSYGKALGQFVRPKGIAVDRDGLLYVVDAGFENVQIFDPNDQLLLFFGGSYEGPGDMWLPAKVIIDYDNLKYFEKYVYKGFKLKYLILVTNQYGPDKVNVYGFVEPR
ncbi:MAG: hypothetical protein GXO77_15410 [Calditrichaeota bacterium]|nr:hypothetical protein [Calditrichota bacterium]